MLCKLFMIGRLRFFNLKVFKYLVDFMKVVYFYVRKNGFFGWFGEHQVMLFVLIRKIDSNLDLM